MSAGKSHETGLLRSIVRMTGMENLQNSLYFSLITGNFAESGSQQTTHLG